MQYLKTIARRIPGLRTAYRFARCHYDSRFRWKPVEDIFTEVCRANKWGGTESVSGRGSDLFQTRVVRRELPTVFRDFSIRTMLDIPCGDFHWMKDTDLGGVIYTGADIVADLIGKNGQHERSNVRFRKLNLIEDKLPRVDLVFCRDCLVHLSNKELFLSLHNICESGSAYLLTTTFTSCEQNRNIATGDWRPLNFEIAPFSFPQPLMVINEECTEGSGAYSDKSLGLWRVEDIRKCLNGVAS